MFKRATIRRSLAWSIVLVAFVAPARPAMAQKITLSPADLYSGLQATKVLLDDKTGRLALDGRVLQFGKERQGVVVTDPIDLGGSDGIIGRPASVKSVQVTVEADVPKDANVVCELRSGANPLDLAGWSDWKPAGGRGSAVAGAPTSPGGVTIENLAGRYVQVRITLAAAAADRLPALAGLTLEPHIVPGPPWSGKLAVADSTIQKIVRSPIDFQYERPDQAKIARFRQAARLDQVVAAGRTDFDKLVLLMDWVGACRNDRTRRRESSGGFYQWDIDKVTEVGPDGRCTIFGHCMSYAETLVTAATSLGFVGSRHLCMNGFRNASHEITEIWVDSLGKWVYFDPSLTNYYFDKQTRVPMNLIEMHALIADKFVPAGKDMNWFRDKATSRVREVGGKAHIGCRLGPSRYGEPMPANYDWGYRHGYLAAGFVQMTPRNDFHSNPQATPRRFGSNPGYENLPFWVDAKTPPSTGGNNWFTRLRDFYWTLNQAGLQAVAAEEGTLLVHLGQSMPFFKDYRATIDGEPVKAGRGGFAWPLKAGRNTLQVAPIDEFGRVGLASSLTVTYEK